MPRASGEDAGPAAVTPTAVVIATAPAGDGGPAALLEHEGTPLIGRLAGQLAAYGVTRICVVTRPAWESEVLRAGSAAGPEIDIRTSRAPAEDLRLLAAIAAEAPRPLVLLSGDILVHGEALHGLIASPREGTAFLAGSRRRIAFRIQVRRGRLVSAASAYHAVRRPNATFLGVIRVAPADLATFAAGAERLATLLDDVPAPWTEELDRKQLRWRSRAAHAFDAEDGEPADDQPSPEGGFDQLEEDESEAQAPASPLPPEAESRVRARVAVAREDVIALVMVALARSRAEVMPVFLRRLFWARPLTPEAAALASERLAGSDEDRALLDSAVKSGDGFFTTFFVSPYSRFIARWAARRGLTPNHVTTISMLIGVVAAAAFATGGRVGLVAGAVLLQVAFVADCVDGQLARYTRTFSSFGAWLDSIFDRGKEYVVFAGLAIGAGRAGDPVWLLACAALTLQTARHMSDFSFGGGQRQTIVGGRKPALEQARDWEPAAPSVKPAAPRRPSPTQRILRAWHSTDRLPGVRWLKKMASFPIGERFAAISVTAAVSTPRTTFIVVLGLGRVRGALYTDRSHPADDPMTTTAAGAALAADTRRTVPDYRDDGPLALALGRLLGPRLPVPGGALLVLGLLPLLVVVILEGSGASDAVAAAVIGWLVLCVGISSRRPPAPHRRWAVPTLVRVGEYGALIWLAALDGESAYAAAYAMLGVLAFRHYDLVYRLRHIGETTPPWLNTLAAGWDGRLLIALVLLLLGVLPAGLFVWAGTLGAVLVVECVSVWRRHERSRRGWGYDNVEDGD